MLVCLVVSKVIGPIFRYVIIFNFLVYFLCQLYSQIYPGWRISSRTKSLKSGIHFNRISGKKICKVDYEQLI